jgi:arylsulfatase A-like enzyme
MSSISRRDLLKGTASGAVFAWLGSGTTACSSSGSSSPAPAGSGPNAADFSGKNILVILTDQERFTMNWPADWADKHLPALARLKNHGVTFTNAYTAACECSPSRAVMMTGQFSTTTGVAVTFTDPLPPSSKVPSIASLLKDNTSYQPFWKGKWHLSMPLSGGRDVPSSWTSADADALQNDHGFAAWDQPDSGTAIISATADSLATAGGGTGDNDGRYTNDVVDFLTNVAPTLNQPFCLFVSLVNPHDISAFPQAFAAAGYDENDFSGLGIALPANMNDDLSKKPSVQAAFSKGCLSAFSSDDQRTGYVNFYAYLHTIVDARIGAILDALDSANLTNETIVIRTADHGELGLSHGMTEKSYTAYEEMTHVPLVVSNPVLFPSAQTTNAFYDHQDLLPTILDLAGIANADGFGNGVGKSVVPVLKDPTSSVRDHTLFAYDDVFGLAATTPASHIRSMRQDDADGKWTYSVYFSPSGSAVEYELYELGADPGQTNNLLFGGAPNPQISAKWKALHATLTASFTTANQLPSNWQPTVSG